MADIASASPEAARDEATLIGRDDELKALESALASDSPVVCTVAGPSATGKSELVEAFTQRARASGWKVIGPVPVSPQTTQDEFSAVVKDATSSLVRPIGSSHLDQQPLVMESVAGGPAADAMKGASESDTGLGEGVVALGAVVLVLDPYRPSKEFDEWLVDGFLSDLSKTSGRVVVVIAHRELSWIRAEQIATVKLRISALSEVEYRRYFEGISTTLRPPLDSNEIDVYVEALCDEPYLVVSFIRALALSRGS